MTETLLLLRLEHRRMAELLKAMEEQLEMLGEGKSPDHGLLQSMLTYLSGYPDQCHHPKEDLLFRKLIRRDPKAAEGLSNILEEHKELARLTEHLAELVKKLPEQPDASLDPLKNTMRHFVDCYYHHMSMEEKHFFPTALRLLSPDDWAEIDFSVFDQTDPLFDDVAEEEFSNLHHKISQLSEQPEQLRATRTLLKNENNQVLQLTNISQFNEIMKDNGTVFRLVKLSEGNYELKAGERLIMGIPECDETCAAWCAHYFLIGKESRH